MRKRLLIPIFRFSRIQLKNRLQWIKNLPIAVKLIVISFILIAVPLGIASYLTYTSYSASIQKNTGKYQMDVVKELTANIDTYMNELNLLTLLPYQSQQILKYLEAGGQSASNLSFNERVTIEDFTKRVFANGRLDISGVTLYRVSGGTYSAMLEEQANYSIKSVEDEPWYEKVSKTGKIVYIGTFNKTALDTNNQVYSFARKIRSVDTGKVLGYLVLDVDKNVIRNKIEAISNEKKNIMIVDNEGSMIYKSMEYGIDSDKLLPYKGAGTVVYKQNNDTELLSYYTSPFTGWTMIEMVPLATLLQDTVYVRNYIILIGAVCLLLAFIIFTIFALRITNPISELRNLMKKVVVGDLHVSIPISSRDEIGQLSQSFNIMVSKLSDLGYRLYESEIREKNAQISALQSQINPHFLYNTLGSISMYAEIQGNREVVKMTNNLSKLLRYSINSHKSQVPLNMELEHVKGYMAIQQIRFEEKIQFHVNIEPELLSYSVIRFILQPIIENSIVHGIDKGNGYGNIILTGKKQEDNMLITIQDDGAGMSAVQLQNLLDKKFDLASSEEGTGGHGLMNVHRRIALRYGNQYGIKIESSLQQGTIIFLTLPLIEDNLEGGIRDA
ncbi:two-component system sensor histidine kinase YesM [Paenibacillus sp. V4I3]|uniref:cache domain-containing sensor histidine kinase n=1 Tax=unclassified Paenibacillus TaxID=185978 RepID=UPI002781472B|nr:MULTISPECIES: sensor histidine kinase [unclassified Paenibacillus]MDQ0877882.1 two-component system sensor histidine kinase YesM [Paenibacillus sp. V4I3]MDQ0886294.1 two-component system sensor histidine kinase YesM [Paenibacillus sp. V4I9]